MGKAWHDRYPIAAAVFTEADHALGIPLSRLCFEGPADDLNRTDVAQAAIYVTSVACHQVLAQEGLLGQPVAAAGLSLGEFTALHLAGAFSFLDGLQLVRLRGQAMQDAALAQPSGMVAIIGADETQAATLCHNTLIEPGAEAGEVLVPVNFNCPGQVVISGSLSACQRALAVADRMGFRATALKVAGAFHSPLMRPAADRLAAALDRVTWTKPRIPVISNVTAQPHQADDIPSIKRRLVEQLTSPVRWSDSMKWIIANIHPTPAQPAADSNSTRYIELAPNKALSGFMRRIDKTIKVENFAEPAP